MNLRIRGACFDGRFESKCKIGCKTRASIKGRACCKRSVSAADPYADVSYVATAESVAICVVAEFPFEGM